MPHLSLIDLCLILQTPSSSNYFNFIIRHLTELSWAFVVTIPSKLSCALADLFPLINVDKYQGKREGYTHIQHATACQISECGK